MAMTSWSKSVAGLTGAALLVLAVPAPAFAQNADSRISRIEREIDALQRAVFPGGDERFFEPEITPQRPAPDTSGVPQVTTSALTDVLARLDALETQVARLTAATEVNENALNAIEARLSAIESGAVVPTSGASTGTPVSNPSPGSQPTGVIAVPDDRAELPAPPSQPAAQPAAGPTDARVAAVQAIVKPETGDAGDDEYSYGYRLWDAGFYPEAQQQLAIFLERYPNHARTSFGRNLLGRAFLDANQPRAAATHFFENYQSDTRGARAPDSLLYLAESMIQLGDTNRACIALAEFGETYPAEATGRLANMYSGLNGRVDCN